VDVAVEQNVSALQSLPHHHLGRTVLRALLHAGSYPLPVQVEPAQRCSVIADENSVGVEHGNYLEHEIVA